LSHVSDFTSDKDHIVERYTFADAEAWKYGVAMEDPSVFRRPWTIASPFHRAHAIEKNSEQF
jgi:hypothetical protein